MTTQTKRQFALRCVEALLDVASYYVPALIPAWRWAFGRLSDVNMLRAHVWKGRS